MNDNDDMSQGGKANHEGDHVHQDIKDVLLRVGFEPSSLSRKRNEDAIIRLVEEMSIPRLTGSPFGVFSEFTVLGTTVYDSDLQSHFLIFRSGWPRPLAIMHRHQRNSGSAMEKAEYLFANINERFPCQCLVVLDGPALQPVRKRARQWITRSQGRLAAVFDSVTDFRRWATDGCKWPEVPASLGI